MSAHPTPGENHVTHADEAIRVRREARLEAQHAQEIVDELALVGRRLDALLAFNPSVACSEDTTGFAPGGYV